MNKICNILKKISIRFMTQLASLTLFIGIIENTKACFLFFHQPQTPDGLENFMKEKENL